MASDSGSGHRARIDWPGLAKTAGAVSGAVGALLYVLLTVLVAEVYAPLHVAPRDLGLGYTELLLGAGVLLLGMVALMLLLMAPGFAVGLALAARSYRSLALVGAGLFVALSIFSTLIRLSWWFSVITGVVWVFGGLLAYASEGVWAREWKRSQVPLILGCLLASATAVAGGLVVEDAFVARERLQDGRPDTVLGGLSGPWRSEVVRVRLTAPSAATRALALPRCLLYLGQADGVSVFWDARRDHQRAVRLPTSDVVVEVLPHARAALDERAAHEAPTSGGDSRSCAG